MTTDLTCRVVPTAEISTERRLTMTECALLSILDALDDDSLRITGNTEALKSIMLSVADGRAVLRGEEIDY